MQAAHQCRSDSNSVGPNSNASSNGIPSDFVRSAECKVCQSAVAGPPEECPNYRLNPSLLIRHTHMDNESGLMNTSFYQIDAGKTFREAALRWYPKHNVACLDALILTHEHADAVFGLDDLRGFQVGKGSPLPVYCSQRDLDSLATRFDYLMPKFMADQSVKRWVSQLDFNVITPYKVSSLFVVEKLQRRLLFNDCRS